MPALPTKIGPASSYMRSMQSSMMAILLFQSVICGCRLVLFLGIMGGFVAAIGIGLGWYAFKEDMHITFICYWGFFCGFNGAFDTVKWIDQVVKMPGQLFSSSLPFAYNATSALSLLVPLSMLLGAPFAWHLYKHSLQSSGEDSCAIGMDSFGSRPPSKNAFGNTSAWKAFSGAVPSDSPTR